MPKNKKTQTRHKLKERGITLIALIITIIVLLILAGVALAALTGDSGIISNSEKAKEQTNLANAKEQVQLAIQGALTEGFGKITKDNLETELNRLLGEGNYTIKPDNETGPWSVTIGKNEIMVTMDGKNKEAVIEKEGTKPWIPEGFSKVDGTDLSTGLVITNREDGTIGNKNYVWIEVPNNKKQKITVNSVEKTITLEEAKTNEEIAEWLEVYAGKGTEQDYTKGSSTQDYSSWKEVWFDRYNATWDGKSEYAYIGVSTTAESNLNKNYPFADWNTYYGGEVYTKDENGEMKKVDFTTAEYSETTEYFAKVDENFKNHDDGCGLSYQEFKETYDKMLNSVQEHGGFWLAQYEAGITPEEVGKEATNRVKWTALGNPPSAANYAKDQYPYNYVYFSEAQKIANADSTDTYISSLPFGIQWDLVCKFLEVSTDLEYENIATKSVWGNYWDASYEINNRNARYSKDYGKTFLSVHSNSETDIDGKAQSKSLLLTTGAIEEITGSSKVTITKNMDASPMNIYDFAGNLREYTLQRAVNSTSSPCSVNSGSFPGSHQPVSYRLNLATQYSDFSTGFRSVMF